LLLKPSTVNTKSSLMTECIRYTIVLYMFLVQGPTYYSHAVIMDMIITRLKGHLGQLESTDRVYDSVDVWILAIGMVASTGTPNYSWFMDRARSLSASLLLENCEDVLLHIKRVLWLDITQGENAFRPHWESILAGKYPLDSPTYAICASTSRTLPR
jgi:multisubunit Na+/H+ antiporter MnhF subunit